MKGERQQYFGLLCVLHSVRAARETTAAPTHPPNTPGGTQAEDFAASQRFKAEGATFLPWNYWGIGGLITTPPSWGGGGRRARRRRRGGRRLAGAAVFAAADEEAALVAPLLATFDTTITTTHADLTETS